MTVSLVWHLIGDDDEEVTEIHEGVDERAHERAHARAHENKPKTKLFINTDSFSIIREAFKNI